MVTNDLEFFQQTQTLAPPDLKKTDFELQRQNPFEIDDQSRAEARKQYLKKFAAEPFELAEERIMFGNDLMSINYLLLGLKCADKVGRIHVKDKYGSAQGYGTGFMVAPQLMMTNNHVLRSAEEARNSIIEFNYQYDASGNPSPTFLFRLTPERFFKTSPGLDYTVVAVEPVSFNSSKKLTEVGYLQMFEESGKALIKEFLTIIQHPNGGYKQIAIRENKLVKLEADFLWYLTDTAPGASGSPVFNDQWQVVALHHKSIPRTTPDGKQIVCKDGSVWQKGMDEQLIAWEANEGIRISVIIADLKYTHNGHPLLKEMFSETGSRVEFSASANGHGKPGEIRPEGTSAFSAAVINAKDETSSAQGRGIQFSVPLLFTVQLGNTQASASVPAVSITEPPAKNNIQGTTAKSEDILERRRSIDGDYNSRQGYNPHFLRGGHFPISLDELLQHVQNKLAPLTQPVQDNRNYLHYQNFSVAINKSRKMSLLTAVNIDGGQLVQIRRENTPWILDPRMDEKYQAGPEVYADNDLDRGHMVRRLDPVWGSKAQVANDDTFHFTNSCPQDKNLNRRSWSNLEDYILHNTNDEDLKVSVFTGPVFSADDIPYRNVKLPLQFYKIAAMIRKDGQPSVTGYLLTQDVEKYRGMELLETIGEDGFGAFKTYQVPLRTIQQLTGLNLERLMQFDPMAEVDPNERMNYNVIENEGQIRLYR